MKKELNKQNLTDIVHGTCFLASGGGGAYSTGMQIADNFNEKFPVTVYDIEEIQKENRNANEPCYAVVTAVIGSPEKMKRIKDGTLNVQAIEKLATARGIDKEQIKCLVPVEIGAISTMISCVTAAKLKLPVLDADGAGRAVPKLNMTTFAVNHDKTKVSPTVLVVEDEYVALEVTEGPTASSIIELLARPILDLPKFDGMAAIALWLI